MPCPERADHPGQERRRQRRGHPDAQAPAFAPARAAGGVDAVGDERQGGIRDGEELGPGGGEGDTAGMTGEERVADLRLKALDLLTQRRLRDTEPPRGPSDVTLLGDDREDPQLAELDFGQVHIADDIVPGPTAYWTYRLVRG
ncbi:hypothetical protein Pen01_05330 [Phytomonospora endophytica]|nr:hypothetical protein Pen01_05330 [Phytomonospora endophytica]